MGRSGEECLAKQALHARCRASRSFLPSFLRGAATQLDTDLHKISYLPEPHHCWWWTCGTHHSSKPLRGEKYHPVLRSSISWSFKKSQLYSHSYFHLRQSISGQIRPEWFILKYERLHFQLLKWQQAHLLHQAADIWPLWIQNICGNTTGIRYPPLCHINPSYNDFGFLVSRELSQGRKTRLAIQQLAILPQLEVISCCVRTRPGQGFSCPVALLGSLTQQNPWITFSSLAAGKRTKANIRGNVEVNGYKQSCPPNQQQTIRSLSWSTEPLTSSWVSSPGGSLSSGQQYCRSLTVTLMSPWQLNMRKQCSWTTVQEHSG